MTDTTEKELQQRLMEMGFHPDVNEHHLLNYIQELLEYSNHTEDCKKYIVHHAFNPVCDCGYDELTEVQPYVLP
jgi:hypothetical protein